MTKIVIRQHPAVYVAIGILISLMLMLLTGAAGGGAQTGRYDVFCVVKGNFTDVYVIDTTSGVVKWVGDDIGKPFEQIKGR